MEGALLSSEGQVAALAALTRLTSLQLAASEYVQASVVRGLLAAAAELPCLQQLAVPCYSGLDAAGLAQLARLTGLGSLTLEQVRGWGAVGRREWGVLAAQWGVTSRHCWHHVAVLVGLQ